MKPLTTPLAFGYITVKFTTSLEANFRTVPKDIFSFSTTSSITASFDCRYSNVPAGPDFMYVKKLALLLPELVNIERTHSQ